MFLQGAPGPPNLPIVGSLPWLGVDVREPLRTLSKRQVSIKLTKSRNYVSQNSKKNPDLNAQQHLGFPSFLKQEAFLKQIFLELISS